MNAIEVSTAVGTGEVWTFGNAVVPTPSRTPHCHRINWGAKQLQGGPTW